MSHVVPTASHALADSILVEIGELTEALHHAEAKMEQELAAFKERWSQDLAPTREQLAALDKELKVYARENHNLFFGKAESCRVNLPHGVLMYDRSDYVVKKRSLTWERLEALGFPEAVKVDKSVNWDLLNTWPEEKLWAVGTEKKTKETFGYELG